MTQGDSHLWGEAMFAQYKRATAMRTEVPHFSDGPDGYEHYNASQLGELNFPENAQKALADPTYDFFSEFKPTRRTKHDVGYYVMQNGIDVPLVTTHAEWQAALRDGTAMLRSDGNDDYEGWSGLFTTKVLPTFDPDNLGVDRAWGDFLYPASIWSTESFAEPSVIDSLALVIAQGLYDGSVNSSRLMKQSFWDKELARHTRDATNYGVPLDTFGLTYPEVSHWHYEKGVPIRVFRDPVVDGRYYIGGQKSHHTWQIENGRDSGELTAYEYKRWERQKPKDRTVAYTLPSASIVDMYERVRTLPFFDQRQAPVMELLYADPDSKTGEQTMKFLQYFKVNQLLQTVPEFTLPSGRNVLSTSSVRGATGPSGIDVRIYLVPRELTERMNDQGVFMNMLNARGIKAQAAARMVRVVAMYELSFKDNHDDSAAIYRPDITIGLWDGVDNLLMEPFASFEEDSDQTRYIDTHLVSNGRKATVESDWTPRNDYS